MARYTGPRSATRKRPRRTARKPCRWTKSSPHLRILGLIIRFPRRVSRNFGRTVRPSRKLAASPTITPRKAATPASTTGRFPWDIQPAQRRASSSGRGTMSVERTTPKMAKNVYVAGSRALGTDMIRAARRQPPAKKRARTSLPGLRPIQLRQCLAVPDLGLGLRLRHRRSGDVVERARSALVLGDVVLVRIGHPVLDQARAAGALGALGGDRAAVRAHGLAGGADGHGLEAF